jgi:AbrB family looped-hinge helix DNA binding protein
VLYFLLKCKAMPVLSTKNQIAIPREARQASGVKPGDELLVVVRGDNVIILKKPKSHRSAIRGLGKRTKYRPEHLQEERQSWD